MSWVYWKWFTYLGKWSLMISSDPGGKKPKLLMATSRVVFTTHRRRTITNENNDVIEREIQTENSFACERISTPDPWGGQIKKAPIVQWSQDHTWVDGPTGWGLPCTWGFWIHGQMPILIKMCSSTSAVCGVAVHFSLSLSTPGFCTYCIISFFYKPPLFFPIKAVSLFLKKSSYFLSHKNYMK